MKNPEEPFLRDFFRMLNVRGIRYAVMRNSDSLPETLDGSDLDLFVADEKVGKMVVDVAKEVAESYSGGCTAYYHSDEIVTCWGGRHKDGEWWGLHLDIVTGVKHLGAPYIEAEALLDERVFVKETFYRSGELSDVVSFLKEILCNRKTKKNYYELAREAFGKRPDQIKAAVEMCPNGVQTWSLIEGLLSEAHGPEYIAARAERIEWSILKGRSVVERFRYTYRKYRRLLFPPSITVAFLGTDGSGKSTVIESIKPFFERMLHSQVHYEHLRPNLLPSLARLAGRPKIEGPVTNPHGGKTAGRISSLLRFFYYYLDYTLGYLLKIIPIMAKRPTLIVFDRYYYEYMIDPKRCAVRLPRGFARFFSLFIPKPSLILCLGGDPEKIFERKPETSIEEVTRQVDELRRFVKGDRRAIWVDTTLTKEESSAAAIAAIVERMKR